MHFRTSPDTSRGLENVFAVAALLATAESLTSSFVVVVVVVVLVVVVARITLANCFD